MEETGVPEENYRPAASHRQTFNRIRDIFQNIYRARCDRYRMVVGFNTTYAISAHQH
jgi:hypothetical protein